MNALDIAYSLLVVVSAPFWARKARGGWGERLGRVEPVAPAGGRPRVMLHAVSVGEVNALRMLVPELARDCDVVVTATTDTGIARARALYSDVASVRRFPLDFSRSVRRFLDTVRPDAVGLVELEVWPNFTRACADRGVPVGVINGRLSERSFRGYRRFRALLRPMFSRLAFADVQDEAYAERFRAMGVAAERVRVAGSMKWDNAAVTDEVTGAAALAASLGIDRSRPVIVAGSTGPGEESLLREACEGLGVQLVCAPRKPERFDEAAAALPGCVRRSSVMRGGVPSPGATHFLLDTIGELGAMYAVADVVVVGRSFGDQHGSDPTEPIGLSKATIIGSAFGDFASIVGAFREAGGIVVTDRARLRSDLERLLADPGLRRATAEAGRACIERHRGASAAHAARLRELVRLVRGGSAERPAAKESGVQ